ncbi:MAG: iron-containing alcohol dehydrogenase, partial [Ruminococcaceae bacterium]|nr:iron-containing alcohol dehydrogenase [Oscillospiraceae bacterium]
MKVDVRTQPDPYTVHIERGTLRRAGEILPLNRRVLVVTDSGVPKEYAETVCAQCAAPTAVTLPSGEETKSFSSLQALCRVMLEKGFTRTDAVVAVGGGVIGDLAGFAASVYMRGIDFFNFPTTLLSQVDSSIGGKTAVNFEGVKNVIGTFYQPSAVLIDPLTLDTLPKRQIASGMAEVIKMAATFDADLFEALENGNLPIEEIIARALQIKARVVEA